MFGLPTWMIVLTGLVFNISSALVTHFIIDGKSSQLNSLALQMSNNSKEMGLLWSQIEGIERKRETLYLLLNQGKLKEPIAQQYALLLESFLHQKVPAALLQDVRSLDLIINDYQNNIRNSIDNKYFLNLELMDLQLYLRKEVSTLRNWSIFLQMIGLSLILARDLSRKRLN
ncbi:hypothetical protein [Psychromonas aquimarina]|uniref:hypothetical protein n=1 Tax=Psychromonas aquimarina TaxID=444919 RepID=UPI0004188E06|nr:hypothetical protein [Psychromonas aquimarina]